MRKCMELNALIDRHIKVVGCISPAPSRALQRGRALLNLISCSPQDSPEPKHLHGSPFKDSFTYDYVKLTHPISPGSNDSILHECNSTTPERQHFFVAITRTIPRCCSLPRDRCATIPLLQSLQKNQRIRIRGIVQRSHQAGRYSKQWQICGKMSIHEG